MNNITTLTKSDRLTLGKSIIDSNLANPETIYYEENGTVKEIELQKVIDAIDHVFAPKITKLKTQGLTIKTSTQKGEVVLKCKSKSAFKKIIDSCLKNMRDGGGIGKEIAPIIATLFATPMSDFEKRRTCGYHFAGGTW